MRPIFPIVVLALAVCALALPTTAFRLRPTTSSILIEAGDEEVCVYSNGRDRFEGVTFHYLVMQGGDDFDVYVRNSENRTIYASFAGEHGLEERIYFTTRSTLEHSYCIDNRRYSKSRKLLKVDVGLTSLKRWKRRIDPLSKLMQRTEGSFMGMHEDQILARIREQNLREGLEKLFSLLTVRGATETVVVVIVTFFNIALITRLLKRVTP